MFKSFRRKTALATTAAMLASLLFSYAPVQAQGAANDILIKSTGLSPSVYYLARNGKRYVFPNQKTFDTWFSNDDSVTEVSPDNLMSFPLGGNVTYRPGFKLIKINTDPKVYAVSHGGVLRWVTTESVAAALYGEDWNQMIDDVPDLFFVNYHVGQPITAAADYSPQAEMDAAETINDDKNITNDVTAPSAVLDLALSDATASAVKLTWTAGGGAGSTGTATSYDVRFSTSPITVANFTAATEATGEPTPMVAGSSQTMTVTGLTANTIYYFALKAIGADSEVSAISNVPYLSTLGGGAGGDTIAPAAVADLALSAATSSAITLKWTAPGDDGSTGTAASYDVRYSTSPITNANFSSATAASGEQTPSLAGTMETMTISGLTAETIYYFALKASDEVPNVSGLSNVPYLSTLAGGAGGDVTAPAAVADLSLSDVTAEAVALTWTAPGDDGSTGTATSYDVRYSTSPITGANFSSATEATGEPTPSAAGVEKFTADLTEQNDSGQSGSVEITEVAPGQSRVTIALDGQPAGTIEPAHIHVGQCPTPGAITWPLTDVVGGVSVTDIDASLADLAAAGDIAVNIHKSDAELSTYMACGDLTPSVAGSSETMTISGLDADTTYYFALKTSDEVPNVSAISNVESATTLAAFDFVPSAVTDLAASEVTGEAVTLSWTAPGDDGSDGTATSYDVRYSTLPITDESFSSATEASGEPMPSVSGTSETMTVSGLDANTLYYFALKTTDEVNNVSNLSNVESATTLAAPDYVPAAVTDLATSDVTAEAVTLSWTAPGDDASVGTATSYDVRYSTAPITDDDFDSATQATDEPTPSVAGSSETMTVSGLDADTTYYFAVKTSDEVHNVSALSNVVSALTLAAPDFVPAAITDLATSNVTAEAVTLSWTAPGDDGSVGTATSYDVRYSTSPITDADFSSATEATGEPTPSVAGTSETMTVSGLGATTLYYFAVKTTDEVSNVSAISNDVSATTLAVPPDAAAPAAIADLALSAAVPGAVTLTWTAPGDDGTTGRATSYDVRYSTSPITDDNFASATQATGEPTPSAAGTTETMTISGLTADTIYYFAVKTTDDAPPNVSELSNVPSMETML